MFNSIAWRDLLFGALIGITFLFVCVLALITRQAKDTSSTQRPVGTLVIKIAWPAGNMSDIDLWCDGPDEPKPIGYSDRIGRHFDLAWDDVPLRNPKEYAHEESCVWHDIEGGDYAANVHVYTGILLPAPVQMTVIFTPFGSVESKMILQREVTLTENGDEQTVLRFSLTKKGEIVPGSVNHLFKPLRSAQ